MKAELKREWVKALRSGEYKQGRSSLAPKYYSSQGDEGQHYCCLGVLYDIGVDGYWVLKHGTWVTEKGSRTGLRGYLGELGLSYSDHRKLIELNDFDNYTFSQIADWIEENL